MTIPKCIQIGDMETLIHSNSQRGGGLRGVLHGFKALGACEIDDHQCSRQI